MASPYTATTVSNYNSNPPSDDGAQTPANRVQWSTQKSKLADPIKTAFDTSETATATAFGKVVGGAGITTTAVDYTVTASDQGKIVKCTVAAKTITTPDATVVGSPFVFSVVNDSTGNITFKGNGSQTVDGVASFTIPAGAGVMVNTDGSNWFTDGKNFFQAGTAIVLNSATFPTTISAVLFNYINGLTLASGGGLSVFNISAGLAADSTNAALMSLTAFQKTTSSWAVGSGNGALDTGAIATTTWYHVFLIMRTDTGVVDVLVSLSASAPTMPTNYTLFRRIGSMKTDGSSHWIKFLQIGDIFIWDSPPLDLNAATGGAATNLTLSVAPGFAVQAIFTVTLNNGAGGAMNSTFWCPTLSTGPTNAQISGAASTLVAEQLTTITNTSGQVRHQESTTNGTVSVQTSGWRDFRGQT